MYPSLKLGDIVRVKGEQTSTTRWPLAQLKEVIPGKEGLVRVVTLKTSKEVYARPVTKLVPLLSEEDKNLQLLKAVWLLAGGMFAPRPKFLG